MHDQSLAAVPMRLRHGAAGRRRSGHPVVRHESRRPERIWTLAVRGGRSSTSGRTWSAGCGSPCRGRAARRSGSGTPRCSEDGELGVRGRCATPRRPTGSCSAAARTSFEPTFTFHGFRYAEVTGWPGELTPETRSRRWSSTPTCSGPAPSSAPTRSSPSCTRTWSGGCAGTSSTYPPTARSATSGSAGPVTSRCSRRRRRTSTTCRRSSRTGWSTSTWSSGTPTGWCRSWCRTC